MHHHNWAMRLGDQTQGFVHAELSQAVSLALHSFLDLNSVNMALPDLMTTRMAKDYDTNEYM